ncbi:hypothetical protein AVEN_15133-1 [Araneus ventricosus]|uniref:Uncharacterized protein n=1 Tax=Araneus ventricosus TaxID=182803 RepID=A0A4Y2KKV1_ARAVE|nr:hypothetical protein AVEN_15133-1 [Araneus ventricosus]
MRGKGRPSPHATSCHITLSYHFTKRSAENAQLWWEHLLLNKLSRIKLAKLISFLNENENLIKQPPVHPTPTQISLLHQDLRLMDSDPYFSPSPRPQTYGLRSRFLSFTKTSDLWIPTF